MGRPSESRLLSTFGTHKMHDSSILNPEVRLVLSTREAARCLGREQQTLRKWACKGDGPILPVRIGGRLGWRVQDIRRLVKLDE